MMNPNSKQNQSILAAARTSLLEELVETGTLSISTSGVASNADSSSKASCAIALQMARTLNARIGNKIPGQSAGAIFENAVAGLSLIPI